MMDFDQHDTYIHASYEIAKDVVIGAHEQVRYIQGDTPEIHVRHGSRWHRVPVGGIVNGARSQMVVRNPFTHRNINVVLGLGSRVIDAIPEIVTDEPQDRFVGQLVTTAARNVALTLAQPFEITGVLPGNVTARIGDDTASRYLSGAAETAGATDAWMYLGGKESYGPQFERRNLEFTPGYVLDISKAVTIYPGTFVSLQAPANVTIPLSGRVLPGALP